MMHLSASLAASVIGSLLVSTYAQVYNQVDMCPQNMYPASQSAGGFNNNQFNQISQYNQLRCSYHDGPGCPANSYCRFSWQLYYFICCSYTNGVAPQPYLGTGGGIISSPFTFANALSSGGSCPIGYQPVRGNAGLPLSCNPQDFGACGTMNYQCIRCNGVYTCCYVDPYYNQNNNLGVRPFVPQTTFGNNFNNFNNFNNNNNFNNGNTGCAANAAYEVDFNGQPRFCDSNGICGVGYTCSYNSVFQRRTCCQYNQQGFGFSIQPQPPPFNQFGQQQQQLQFPSGPSGFIPGPSGFIPGPGGFNPGPSGFIPGPSGFNPGPSGFFPGPSGPGFPSGPAPGSFPGPNPAPSPFFPGIGTTPGLFGIGPGTNSCPNQQPPAGRCYGSAPQCPVGTRCMGAQGICCYY